MEPTKLLEGLFDKKKIQLLKLFLDAPEREFGLREAAKAAKLPPATTYRIMGTLLKLEIIQERKIKQLRLYTLNQNKTVKFLDELLAVKKTAIEGFLDNAKALTGIQEIIQHGKATKEKVSLLVIGQNIDAPALATLVGDIKEQYKFTILHLILSPEQYDQMASMGLYSGEKQSLYRR